MICLAKPAIFAGLQTYGKVGVFMPDYCIFWDLKLGADRKHSDFLARLLLNYKNVSYKTEWVDFPDIKPVLQSCGVESKKIDALGAAIGAQYTLPTIRLPDGSFTMDSATIATLLEEICPNPFVHLDTCLQENIQAVLGRIAWALYPELAPLIRDNLLTEKGKPHWVDAREKLFGMPIDELHRTKGGKQAWAAAKPDLIQLRQFVKVYKKDDGPFVLGNKISYADFLIVSLLMSAKRAGQALFDGIVGEDEGLIALWNACQIWLERDR
jgi:glutathione S-transferase